MESSPSSLSIMSRLYSPVQILDRYIFNSDSFLYLSDFSFNDVNTRVAPRTRQTTAQAPLFAKKKQTAAETAVAVNPIKSIFRTSLLIIFNHIAKTAHRFDVNRLVWLLLNFIPEPFDINGQRVVLHKIAVNVPYILEQLIA